MTIAGFEFAYCNGKKVNPFPPDTIFHGSKEGDPDSVAQVMRYGLPSRGPNLELLDHAEGQGKNGVSAFRGATIKYCSGSPPGAWDWAGGTGGVVYRIENYPGYDLAGHFQDLPDHVKNGRGLMGFENETAIPAEVPSHYITQYGFQLRDKRDRPRWEWYK